MTTFADDFNRPDGAIGNNWLVTGVNCRIVGGEVQAGANSTVRHDTWPAGPVLRAAADCWRTNTTAFIPRVYTRGSSDLKYGYYARLSTGTTTDTVLLIRVDNDAPTTLASQVIPHIAEGPRRLEVVDNDGVLSVKVNGTPYFAVADNTYHANTYVGFWVTAGYGRVDNFAADDIAATALDATPEPIVQMAVEQGLSFVGTGTAWTPGTPGAPTFTVDKGTLSNQSVQDPTHATADYLPPQADDTATFTDPSTGQTDAVALSTGFQVNAGGDNSDVLAVLGTPPPGHTVTGDQTALLGEMVMPDPPPSVTDIIDWFVEGFVQATVPQAILEKLDALYGKLPPEQQILSLETLTQTELSWLNRNIGLLTDDVASIAGEEELSLRATINAICGVPNYTVKEVADLIAALTNDGTYSLLSVLQWITSVRGANNIDLTDIYSLLSSVAPPDLTPITDYLDWLTSTKSISLSPIKTAADTAVSRINATYDELVVRFNALTNSGVRDLQQIQDAIANLTAWLNTRLNDIGLAIQTNRIAADNQYNTLYNRQTTIMSKLDTLQSDVTYIREHLPLAQAGAPVWPGLASVTIGQQKPLAVGVTLEGPLHGIILDVTSGGQHGPPFQFDGDLSYQKLGAVTFQSDSGDNELPQLLGFGHAIATPHTMKVAQRAKFRFAPDVAGTVTAWRLTS